MMVNNIENIEFCTGCSSCFYVCPNLAITITQNEKGFFCPVVSHDKCINCGMCMKVCHIANDDIIFSKPHLIMAAKNKSEKERRMSSSGGIFLLFAKYIIEKGGIVYGAAFDEDNTVRHIRAESIEEVERCCQSKYVQSNVVDAFRWIIEDIKSERKVLFVGTPCQVSALKSFLTYCKTNHENLLLMDFICHGTPSPLIFKDYLSMIEKKYKDTIREFYFRDKDQGWRGNGYKAVFYKRKPVINGFYLRGYNKLFPLATNEACFHCSYSKPERVSDITIGDFWGIESSPISGFEDDLGVSMVLLNTENGQRWFDRIQEHILYQEAKLDYCKKNTPLFHSPKKSSLYDIFWEEYLLKGYEHTFDVFCKFNGVHGLYERFKWFIMYKLNLKNAIILAHSKLKKES